MSLASNLLQLIFSLIVGIASLLGALFIIGFLLAVPRNDFEDDSHDVTQPIFIPPVEDCPLQTGLGLLPVDCSVVDTGLREFNRTSCDNTVCEGCSEDENVTCCCQDFTTTNFTFMCQEADPRPFIQPDACSCQRCDDISVQLTFQVISSSDGNILNNAMINITDSVSTVPLSRDGAGFFNTIRQVRVGTVEVTTSAPDHLTQTLNINILPPGPIQVVVILAAAVVQSLGANVNNSLSFDVGQVVSVGIPENTVITLDNEPFEGDVNVRTVFFSMDQSTFSSEFPPEVTVNSGGALTFYTTRVLAMTELFDENGNTLNISASLSLSVNFSQFSSGDTVSLLLYDSLLGTWVEQSTFNITAVTTAGKRQAGEMTGVASLPSTDTFWAIALAIEPTDICYLQVRTFEGEGILAGVTVSVEQFRDQLGDPFFFRSIGETGDGSGPVDHSACVEVLCGSVTSGTISAAFNQDVLDPSETQPDGLTINGSTVTFISSTEATPPSPFYSSRDQCIAASNGDANTFVRFDVQLEPPPIIILPVEDPENFWFVRVDVLGCFDSNRVSTVSNNPMSGQASVFTTTLTETNNFVTIPTTISPEACNGQVTRRTACVEAYDNSMVTLQAELNQDNTVSGPLCFLSELTDLGNSLTRGVRTAELDLTTLNAGNTTAGLYFGNDRFATLDECLNPSSTDGIFAQFECFEHPADSMMVDLPAGCEETAFNSQTCSQVPCTTDTGACTDGSGVQCCYREATDTEVSITCLQYNTLTFNQSQTCSCMPCDDIIIDVIVTVTSSTDGEPLMGAMVDYTTTAGGITGDIMTDSLGMFTITQPISNGSVAFTITEPTHVMEEHPPVDLIPPGPIRISVVLRSRVTETRGPTMNNVVNVGNIANATLSDQLPSNVTSEVSYVAAEMPRSFDTTLPPPVVTNDDTFYAVRVIATTRLSEDNGTTINSTANVQITFNSTMVPDVNTMLSLLTFDDGPGVWSASTMDLSSSTSSVTANATLSNTELPWAIGNPVGSDMICYVQVRTFRRDNNPLEDVEVEVLQLFEQFGETFFFRSVGITGDTSASATHAACLPVLCNYDGMIRARYHVNLDANVAQPMGFIPAGQSVNKTITSSSDNGPLFPSAAACNAANGQYVRFDLPIANPPPANIEPATNDDGFVFLRVSWYDCLESNQVFTVSSDSSSNILAIYGITVNEMGEIDDGLHSMVNGRLIDYLSSGGMPNCTDSLTAVTSRTACIQVEPNANVTLQVELNDQSSMRETGNELCSLNKTIGSLMEADASDNRLRFDLQELRSQFDPQMNMTMLNDMGIYYDSSSANVAYTQCMNIPYSNNMAELYGSIAVFSCFTP